MYLAEEDSVFMNGEVDRKQPRGERGAESVAVHQCYLCADWLVLEEVFLRGYHVGENLAMGFHDLCHSLLGDLGQKLKTVVGLVQYMCM